MLVNHAKNASAANKGAREVNRLECAREQRGRRAAASTSDVIWNALTAIGTVAVAVAAVA